MIIKGLGHSNQRLGYHQRLAIFQRYSGLRISQILAIKREDIDTQRRVMVLRADALGSKGADRDTSVPIHPDLAVLVKEWRSSVGHLFSRIATKGPSKGWEVVPRGADVAEVFTTAWVRAGVPESRWGAVGRLKARPTNAIRARWKSTIAGVAGYEMAAMMVGQNVERADHLAYVAMGNPEASPYWSKMASALTAIPTLHYGDVSVASQAPAEYVPDEDEG